MAAERILHKQSMHFIVQKIFLYLEDYLKEQGKRILGEKPTVLTLSDIKSVRKVGRTGLQLITASINSDAGSFLGSLAIKRFKSKEEYDRAVSQTRKLLERLNLDKSTLIKTPAIISTVDQNKTVIYEGISGATFDDSPLAKTDKLYLAGKALATYHRADNAIVSIKRYRYLIERSINGIPIPESKKKKYEGWGYENLENHIKDNWSGTAAFGDFHSENIIFEEITRNDGCGDKQIITWLIDPEFSENILEGDRMEDIATFFIFPALKQFKDKKNVKAILRELDTFIKGYNSHLAKFGKQLELYYNKPYNKIFLFHLGLNAFLRAYYWSSKDPKNNLDQITYAVSLGRHCWKKALQKE